MTDYQKIAVDLSMCAAMKKVIEAREKELKLAMASHGRGSVIAETDLGEELGRISIPKPTQYGPKIVDESAAVGWAVDEFGETAMAVRLSETGKADVEAAAKKAHAEGQALPPGVEIPEPVRRGPSFTPSRDVLGLVSGMLSRGALQDPFSTVLPIEVQS